MTPEQIQHQLDVLERGTAILLKDKKKALRVLAAIGITKDAKKPGRRTKKK